MTSRTLELALIAMIDAFMMAATAMSLLDHDVAKTVMALVMSELKFPWIHEDGRPRL
jgi:hypothetical protein